jgi:hypothetical protein
MKWIVRCVRIGKRRFEMKPAETLWGGYEEEDLTHETADEAIEAIIDDWDPPYYKTIAVWEYKRKELPPVDKISEEILDILRDRLDEDYGSLEEETTIPNEVRIAAERFAQVVRQEWPVWRMDRTENKVVVNVGEWLKEHQKSTEDG